MSLAAATAAGINVQLEGRNVELRPLTLGDFGDFALWCQFRPYNRAKAAGGQPDDLRELWKECTTTEVDFESETFAKGMMTHDGIIELLYLSAKHKQPDITRDFFKSLSIKTLVELQDSIAAISRLGVADDQIPATNEAEAVKKNSSPNM